MTKYLILVFVFINLNAAYAEPNWSTDLSASRATTLTCKGVKSVGVSYFENNGAQADKGCKASCTFLGENGKKYSAEFSKKDIPENFSGSGSGVNLDFEIVDSRDAKLTCDN